MEGVQNSNENEQPKGPEGQVVDPVFDQELGVWFVEINGNRKHYDKSREIWVDVIPYDDTAERADRSSMEAKGPEMFESKLGRDGASRQYYSEGNHRAYNSNT